MTDLANRSRSRMQTWLSTMGEPKSIISCKCSFCWLKYYFYQAWMRLRSHYTRDCTIIGSVMKIKRDTFRQISLRSAWNIWHLQNDLKRHKKMPQHFSQRRRTRPKDHLSSSGRTIPYIPIIKASSKLLFVWLIFSRFWSGLYHWMSKKESLICSSKMSYLKLIGSTETCL